MTVARPLNYYGSKERMCPTIYRLIPPGVETWVDLFCGSAVVTLKKPLHPREVINDLNRDVINLFEVLRSARAAELFQRVELTPYAEGMIEVIGQTDIGDDPVARAWRFLVLSWFRRHGGTTNHGFRWSKGRTTSPELSWAGLPGRLAACVERLRGICIRETDALKLIDDYDSPETLLFVDPPYPGPPGRRYTVKMSDDQHQQLAERLAACKARVILTMNPDTVYSEVLAGWHVHTVSVLGGGQQTKPEIILTNYEPLPLLRGLPENSVDSCVADPPYGLNDHPMAEVIACLTAWLAGQEYRPRGTGFMGRAWDAWVPGPEVWREVLRVLKPGGHCLVFAGSRSMDLMMIGLRLAGFEVRDAIGHLHTPLLAWVYGSGMPKGLDVSAALDALVYGEHWAEDEPRQPSHAGAQFEGWNTTVKPAFEPIVMARKPLVGSVAANVLAWGTGGINVDACRIPTAADDDTHAKNPHTRGGFGHAGSMVYGTSAGAAEPYDSRKGRLPANIVHDGSPAVLAGFAGTEASARPGARHQGQDDYRPGAAGVVYGSYSKRRRNQIESHFDDAGSAARFFYCAKASAADRDEGLRGFEAKPSAAMSGNLINGQRRAGSGAPIKTPVRANTHPTVKPTDLMRWLCRLVTPRAGLVLDPFMGSGSTGKAAVLEGFRFIGIEREPEYVEIARARIAHAEAEARRAAAQPSLFDGLAAGE